jgi:2''-aminoglycoside nucleotidyltransferase
MSEDISQNTVHIEAIRMLFDEAERRGILLWLENGWAIDARVGRSTRDHEDIDVVFPGEREREYHGLISSLGYGKCEETDCGFLSWKDTILLDSERVYKINGQYNFPGFPSGCFPTEKEGIIEGYAVRCVSWEAMYLEYVGYMDETPKHKWRAKDHEGLRIVESHVDSEVRKALNELYRRLKEKSGGHHT